MAAPRRKSTRLLQISCGIMFLFSAANFANAAGYDFYVDVNSVQATEDGSEQFPFKSINAAVGHIDGNRLKGKTIFVKKGVYNEAVILSNNTKLFGESRHETIINAENNKYGIHIGSSKSVVKNLTVQEAGTNLVVTPKAQATIEDCVFKGSGVNGVSVEKGSARKSFKFTFRNSSVTGSGKRGMYIFRRKIEITGSEVSGSEEEGIDLHTNVKGKISNNTLSDNKEGGLELIVGGTSLTISGNHISGNHNSGIAVQVYSAAKGKVKISSNSIKNNHKWGIRYVDFYGKKGHKFKDFVDGSVKLSKNTISGNNEGDTIYN